MDPHDFPIITPHLVFPTLHTCEHDTHHYPALVFARHGALVIFAAEYARRFGVGVLNEDGRVVDAEQHPTLDGAARTFLTRTLAS